MRWIRRDDGGAAMITTLLIGAVGTGIGIAAINVSTSNLRNAGRDRVATGALGAAEAGIAHGIAYLRDRGVGALRCSPGCATNPYGNRNAPMTVNLGDGRQFTVWIAQVQPFSPPTVKVGTYRIHAEGTTGTGPGKRVLEQTVSVKPFEFPIGIYAHTITINGNPNTFQESVFSGNCISGREKMIFEGTDAYYGGPSAAHSVKWISEKNGTCSSTNRDNIHLSASCSTRYPNDRDAQGSNTCSPPSHFTQEMLDSTYGRGLTDTQLATLRAKAQEQGYYFTSATGWRAPNPVAHPHAVLYFKVGANDTVTVQSELDAYTKNCTDAKTVVIVVDNGSVGSGGLHLNSNANLMGVIYVQKGNFQYNGGATWTGSVYANSIDKWNGNARALLDECFLANMPGGILEIHKTRFREVDRI